MRGSTHVQIGMLVSTALVTSLVMNRNLGNDLMNVYGVTYGTTLASLGFTLPTEMSLAGILVGGLGAAWVDSDTAHSIINRKNPVVATANYAIEKVESVLNIVFKLAILLIIFLLSNQIILASNKIIKGKVELVVYSVCLLTIGLTFSKQFAPLRFLEVGRNKLESIVRRLFNISMAGIVYMTSPRLDIVTVLIMIFFIGTAIFPHRSFLHSIEGLICAGVSATYAFKFIGHSELAVYFCIGYFSHIYLADALTVEGVPVLFTPRLIKDILEKLHIRNKFITSLSKLRIKLPPFITTGSVKGNLFETGYKFVLLLICLYLGYKYNWNIPIKLI